MSRGYNDNDNSSQAPKWKTKHRTPFVSWKAGTSPQVGRHPPPRSTRPTPRKTPMNTDIGTASTTADNYGALKLFPALCAATKIDCSKVEIVNMQPNLREQMLMQGQVDGVFGYITTIRFSAKLTGVDPDKQLRFIKFEDYGMDLYSNAIIVSRKFVNENPEAVNGFLKALNQAAKDPN